MSSSLRGEGDPEADQSLHRPAKGACRIEVLNGGVVEQKSPLRSKLSPNQKVPVNEPFEEGLNGYGGRGQFPIVGGVQPSRVS